MQALLPIIYLFNDQYNTAELIIKKFKNKPFSASGNFKSYGEAYTYVLDKFEEKATTHPDFSKVRELLKN